MTTFRVLGPLEVVREGRRIRPSGKPAALLVALLLRRGEVVPADTLLGDVWDDRLPRSAAKLLQAHVSQLRKLLGRDWLQTVGSGYVLAAEPDDVDLGLFELRLREAEQARARGEIRSALDALEAGLAHWRGPPLANLRDEPYGRRAADRLDELRLHALETRIDLELALGAGRELVPQLHALVADHPLRERLRGQLMLALYRGGRQGDALAQFRETRELLVSTLGLEPTPELRRLQEAILRQDEALEIARPPAPASSFLLVGEDERAASLFGPLARVRGSELLLVRLVDEASELAAATAELDLGRRSLVRAGIATRVAALRRDGAPNRLAGRPGTELVVFSAGLDELRALDSLGFVLEETRADVALLAAGERKPADGPVVVGFGGGENEWAALELGAALAQALDRPLVVAGGRREDTDATGTLAAASLAVQRALGIVATPRVVSGGSAGVAQAAEGAAALVLGFPDDWRSNGLGSARLELAAAAPAPILLVRRGLRISSFAPEEAITRFTWSG